MIRSDKAVNQFLETIRNNIQEEKQGRVEHVGSKVTINGSVHCTIIVGSAVPTVRHSTSRRSKRQG